MRLCGHEQLPANLEPEEATRLQRTRRQRDPGSESKFFQATISVTFKAHSHYCVFCVRLRQTVVLLRRDRKIPISALMQSTAESADRRGECE